MGSKKTPTWESDRSLELLMQWLKKEHIDATRSMRQLSADANAFLKANGIANRSESAVTHKLQCLKKAVMLARRMLTASKCKTLEECPPRMRRSILRDCPDFEKLDSVFPEPKVQRPGAKDPSTAEGCREAKRARVDCNDRKPDTRHARVPPVASEPKPLVERVREEALRMKLGAARDLRSTRSEHSHDRSFWLQECCLRPWR